MGLEFGRWAHLPREIHAVGAAPPPTRPQSRTCLQGVRVRVRVKARVGVGVRLRLRLRLRVSPNLPGRRAVACTGGIPTRPST